MYHMEEDHILCKILPMHIPYTHLSFTNWYHCYLNNWYNLTWCYFFFNIWYLTFCVIEIANFASYLTYLDTIITNVLACHKLYIVGLILDKELGCSYVSEWVHKRVKIWKAKHLSGFWCVLEQLILVVGNF